jgi:hypothetical protein
LWVRRAEFPASTSLIPIDPAKIDEEREKVYQYDWYDEYPPSEEPLKIAYDTRHTKSL